MRLITIAFSCLITGTAALARTSPLLTVDHAVARAVRHNPRLSAAVREVAAAQAGVRSARALSSPEAQRTYRAVPAEYTNALADAAQARAELERAAGAVPADLLPAPQDAAPTQNRRPK